MSWAIRNDELALRGCEVSVGNIDGDPLLAFGAEAVGEQRKVHPLVPTRE